MKNILTTLLILLYVVSFSQTKVELEVENENGKEEYKLRVEREVDGETVVIDKTYSSKEEMENDPELKDLNLHFMESYGTSVSTPKGQRIMVVKKEGEEANEDQDIVFYSKDKGEDGDIKIEVRIDEDGNKHVLKNGKEVDIDELDLEKGEMIFISKDGSTDDLKKLSKEGHKMMFISDEGSDGDVKIEVTIDEDGKKHVIKNGVEVDLDELHEGGENVFIMKSGDKDVKFIEEKMEVEVTVDEDGKRHVTVNGEEVDYSPDSYREGKPNNLHNGSGKMEWVEEGEDGKHIKKEVIIIEKDGEGVDGVNIEVIVDHIVLHLEDINEADERAFSLENSKELKLDEFNFYPNPSNGTFQLSFNGKERATTIKVTDINGKEMYVENLQDFNGSYDNEINLSGLKKGIYLLQVVQGSKAVNKKIVIE